MVHRAHHIMFPNSNARMRAINRHLKGCGYNSHLRPMGEGIGSVLLDGGIGGQSSYNTLEDYENTTKRNPMDNLITRPQRIQLQSGTGLADKIAAKLSKLKLDKPYKPKKKNITMSF